MNGQNIKIDHHFICKHNEIEIITIPPISSQLQIADLFIKAMSHNSLFKIEKRLERKRDK